MYAGENIDWIKDFTARANIVAKALNITFELVYAGRKTLTRRGWIQSLMLLRRNRLVSAGLSQWTISCFELQRIQ